MLINLIAHIESEQNCNSLKWSYKRWRAQGLGIYPNWALLGYMFEPTAEDDYHKWVIVEAEADVPRAMAEALRSGKLGVMDYYNMQNVVSDTEMRRAIARDEDKQ